MEFHRLIPLFGNNTATKFYLNRKYLDKKITNAEWEKYGSLVKDYHNKTDLNQHLNILKQKLSGFEKKIIKENFMVYQGNKDITHESVNWKKATKIVPYQTFNRNKIIYQGYNKNHFKGNLNLKKLRKNKVMTGGGDLKILEPIVDETDKPLKKGEKEYPYERDTHPIVRKSYIEKLALYKNKHIRDTYMIGHRAFYLNHIYDNLIKQIGENIDDELKGKIKKHFDEYYTDLYQLQAYTIRLGEYNDLIKESSKKTIDLNNIEDEVKKEQKLAEKRKKLSSSKKLLIKTFNNIGIYDLSKYNIHL